MKSEKRETIIPPSREEQLLLLINRISREFRAALNVVKTLDARLSKLENAMQRIENSVLVEYREK